MGHLTFWDGLKLAVLAVLLVKFVKMAWEL
jgi:hypothetical protein